MEAVALREEELEQRTVQGETESEPVGSRTDTVARGNVGVLVG